MSTLFLSGNEAFAHGVRLANPHVISAYPITPQTIVVERLSEMVEDGSLESEFIHVESEHSALSCAIGASVAGVRTFTATSSQGLLYMTECLPYAAGGRFPIVMMNANRSIALPWNIYGDQRDSLALLDLGWIQAYAKNAQESLDLALMSYYIAEHREVSLPFMVNLDGFVITHTYESVEVPEQAKADQFLPAYETENKIDFDQPKNFAFSAGPEQNMVFHYKAHQAMLRVRNIIQEAEERFAAVFGRAYPGLIEGYRLEDAEYVLVTLGSIAGACEAAADAVREQGIRAGVLRIRYMRPFPGEEIAAALKGAAAVGVLEKDISFGNDGTVYTNVNAALLKAGLFIPSSNYIGGLGGKDISGPELEAVFRNITGKKTETVFLGVKDEGGN